MRRKGILKHETFEDILKKHHIEPTTDGLKDLISDYEQVTKANAAYVKKYETEVTPDVYNGVYLCPLCKHRVFEMHTHCHWCGQKLGWHHIERDRRERFDA